MSGSNGNTATAATVAGHRDRLGHHPRQRLDRASGSELLHKPDDRVHHDDGEDHETVLDAVSVPVGGHRDRARREQHPDQRAVDLPPQKYKRSVAPPAREGVRPEPGEAIARFVAAEACLGRSEPDQDFFGLCGMRRRGQARELLIG